MERNIRQGLENPNILSQQDKQTILDEHNNVRRSLTARTRAQYPAAARG